MRVLVALLVLLGVASARPPETPPPKPPSGFLTLDSQPFATIYIDGKRYGETPLVKLALSPGKHVVRAVLDNGSAQRVTFQIDVGKTVFHRFTWDLQTPDDSGYLVLTSVPSAAIWIDGVDTKQKTPVKNLALAPGRHKVTFLVGSDRYTYAVMVKAGETVMMHKDLQ